MPLAAAQPRKRKRKRIAGHALALARTGGFGVPVFCDEGLEGLTQGLGIGDGVEVFQQDDQQIIVPKMPIFVQGPSVRIGFLGEPNIEAFGQRQPFGFGHSIHPQLLFRGVCTDLGMSPCQLGRPYKTNAGKNIAHAQDGVFLVRLYTLHQRSPFLTEPLLSDSKGEERQGHRAPRPRFAARAR